jgi:AraC-like DNA-binding protein
MDEYATRIARQAMVHPRGMPGAIVAGFYAQLAPTFPVEVFADVPPALAWLGWDGVDAWHRELDELCARLTAEPPIVRDVRALVAASLVSTTLQAVARALRVTPRTLQRRLREAGTSFQAELDRARVHAAQARMVDCDDKLAAIALAVGCASQQHFIRMFRKVTGETPAAWRERHR